MSGKNMSEAYDGPDDGDMPTVGFLFHVQYCFVTISSQTSPNKRHGPRRP